MACPSQLKDFKSSKTHPPDSLYFKSQCPNAMTIITRKRPNPHSQKLETYGVVLQKSKKVSTP
ncbi:hypothetical protein BZK25_03955 [Helicobacter pylori]|nr:hypothetical protein BZK25_03955 [Helicobacter pylori]